MINVVRPSEPPTYTPPPRTFEVIDDRSPKCEWNRQASEVSLAERPVDRVVMLRPRLSLPQAAPASPEPCVPLSDTDAD